MTDSQWKTFFELCAKVLGPGGWHDAAQSTSWCAWTLFDRLDGDFHYWTSGLPAERDIADSYIRDHGVWHQPFLYNTLAHVVIPREFRWEAGDAGNDTYTHGKKRQDLDNLSKELSSAGIPHRLTNLILEIKLY